MARIASSWREGKHANVASSQVKPRCKQTNNVVQKAEVRYDNKVSVAHALLCLISYINTNKAPLNQCFCLFFWSRNSDTFLGLICRWLMRSKKEYIIKNGWMYLRLWSHYVLDHSCLCVDVSALRLITEKMAPWSFLLSSRGISQARCHWRVCKRADMRSWTWK